MSCSACWRTRPLPRAACSAGTAVGEWTVKDIGLHLLDGDLTRLSAGRDRDSTGLLPTHVGAPVFAALLAAKNQRWLAAAAHLSDRVAWELLADATARIDQWKATADCARPPVSAGPAPSRCRPGLI